MNLFASLLSICLAIAIALTIYFFVEARLSKRKVKALSQLLEKERKAYQLTKSIEANKEINNLLRQIRTQVRSEKPKPEEPEKTLFDHVVGSQFR
jgi:hypothetical protein